MMELIGTFASLIALILLEIILGIDNLVMLSILTQKLPPKRRKQARQWGLLGAWMARLILLGSAVYMVHLVTPVFTVGSLTFSARDIFLCVGGAFLICKATEEIHKEVLSTEPAITDNRIKVSFRAVVTQIIIFDLVFSIDSVLTAVGLTNKFWIMAVAISCAIAIMIWASEVVSAFIERHPTIKVLALSYLILIGMILVADGFSFHIPRGYVYFAMGFSLAVEALNLFKKTKKTKKR